MVLKTVLYTLGIAALIKGLVVLISQKSIIHWALKLSKNPKTVRKLAIMEIIIALILIVIGYSIS
jgi:uncharacterized membrane protein